MSVTMVAAISAPAWTRGASRDRPADDRARSLGRQSCRRQDRGRRDRRGEPRRRRGQSPARFVTAHSRSLGRERYQGLRPLRIEHLEVAPGEQLRLSVSTAGRRSLHQSRDGRDAAGSRGNQRVRRPTAAIQDSADWLATLDRFGIVSSERFCSTRSVIQNLAVPFTLEIEPPPGSVQSA